MSQLNLSLKRWRLKQILWGIHGLIDGLYITSSMIDWVCRILTNSVDDASDALKNLGHLFYTEPIGIGFIVTAGLVFVPLSILGCITKKTSWAAYLWPYVRDFLSGLKNGHHAVMNPAALTHTTAHVLPHFFNPIGIVVGILYAAILIWYRFQRRKREDFTEENEKNYIKLWQCNEVDEEKDDDEEKDLAKIENKIHRYSTIKSVGMYFASVVDGTLDGLYLFGCLYLVMSISLLTIPVGGPLFAAIAVISVMAFVSLVSKVIREYEEQKALKKSAAKCDLALARYKMLQAQKEYDSNKSAEQLEKWNKAKAGYGEQLQKYENVFISYSPKTKTGSALWSILREIINGLKNSTAALDMIGNFIKKAVIGFVILITVGSVYAFGLAIKFIVEEVKGLLEEKGCHEVELTVDGAEKTALEQECDSALKENKKKKSFWSLFFCGSQNEKGEKEEALEPESVLEEEGALRQPVLEQEGGLGPELVLEEGALKPEPVLEQEDGGNLKKDKEKKGCLSLFFCGLQKEKVSIQRPTAPIL